MKEKRKKKTLFVLTISGLFFALFGVGLFPVLADRSEFELEMATDAQVDEDEDNEATDTIEEKSAECVITSGKGSVIDLNAMAECMENRYGVDKDAFRRSKKKVDVPTVEVGFDNTSPVEGEEVTAMAIAKFFKNNTKDLYYTWYLIHEEAAADGITEEELERGKKEAMGIVARGKYDPELFGETYSADTGKDDGFAAPVGGADGVGAKEVGEGWGVGLYDDSPYALWDDDKMIVHSAAITRCYDHNFGLKFGAEEDPNAGRDLIVECEHKFANCGGITGDGEFGLNEEKCWKTDPTREDTDEDGVRDEADVAGLGQNEFTWTYHKGDQVGVIIEGTSLVAINEGGIDVPHFAECGWFNGASCGSSEFESLESLKAEDREKAITDNPDVSEVYPVNAKGKQVEWGAEDMDHLVAIFTSAEAASAACESCLPGALVGATESTLSEASEGTVTVGGADANGATSMEMPSETTGASVFTLGEDVDVDGDGIVDEGTSFNGGVSAYNTCLEGVHQECNHFDPNDPDDEERLEVWLEEHDYNVEDGRTNAYYKIMWAMPDFAAEGEDAGFNYPKAISIDEKGKEILDPEASAYPKNPQFNKADPERSDLITVTAGVNNEGVDDDFLYYKWIVWKCKANDRFTCDTDVTSSVEWESFNSGLGVNKARFIPTQGLFESGEEVAWLKAAVIVSGDDRYIGGSALDPDQNYFPIGAIDEVMISVTVNNIDLRLYRAVRGAGDGWVLGEEICADKPYSDICPVYPFEVVAARAIAPSGDETNFAWQLNQAQLQRPLKCVMSSGCDGYGDTVFFPVHGAGKSLNTLSVTANRAGESNMISEKLLSVYNPVGVVAPASSNLTPTKRYDGEPSEFTFESASGQRVSLKVEKLIPDYLEFEEVNILWYVNGQIAYDGTSLMDNFIATNPDLSLAVSENGKIISFINEGLWGRGIEVSAMIEKPVDDQDLLEDAWKILDSHTLTQDSNVTVKVAAASSFEAASLGDKTLKKFLASSLHNAPHYLVFILRLAVAMVLMWSVLFGLTYAVKLNRF